MIFFIRDILVTYIPFHWDSAILPNKSLKIPADITEGIPPKFFQIFRLGLLCEELTISIVSALLPKKIPSINPSGISSMIPGLRNSFNDAFRDY